MQFLPFLFYFYNTGNITWFLVLFVSSSITDLFDGFIARNLRVTSRFGADYDAATDFALVIGIFSFFSTKGFYPIWFLLLITTSFIMFLASSFYAKKLYDPTGRYIGKPTT